MNLLQDIYMYRMGGWEVIYDLELIKAVVEGECRIL